MNASKKSREEIKLMKVAGSVVAMVHQAMKKEIKPGVTTKYLDEIAHKIIKENKCIPSFLGYNGFPGTICASLNDEVVHGIPSEKTVLNEGDIISIDVGATFRGLVGDGAWTYPVGTISADNKKLLEVTEKSLMNAIATVHNDSLLNDIGAAIEDTATESGLGIVRYYGGHGVGRKMHEDPFIYNWRNNPRFVLKSGMTIAIEPMLNLGCDEVYTLEDEWTVVTADKKPSAHFEHTVLVTDDGAEILTKLD